MVELVRVTGDNQVGVRVRLEDGSYFVAPATISINAQGSEVAAGVGGSGLSIDENGDVRVVQPDTVDRATLDLSQAGNTMEMPIGRGQGVLGVDITGLSGSGATVVAESTVGLIWLPMNQLRVGAGGAIPMSATDDGSFRSSVVAKTRVRLRVSVAGTGTAQVSYSLSTNASLVQLSASIPPGNNKLGTVEVLNFPAFPASFSVSNLPATQPVSGTVNVGNLPATQPVSGSVTVSNFPAAFQVSNFPATQTIAGTVNVGNFPATQAVTVGNFPTTQQVVGIPGGTAPHAITPKTATNVSAFVASTAACNFFGAVVIGAPNGAGAYVLAMNRTTIPASGAALDQTQILAVTGFTAGNGASLVPDQFPDRFSTGCTILVSTSTTTYTPLTSNLPIYIKVRTI